MSKNPTEDEKHPESERQSPRLEVHTASQSKNHSSS